MEETEKEKAFIWVAVNGTNIKASTNLKGVGKQIGAKYPTLKSKTEKGKVDLFSVFTGKGIHKEKWIVNKVELTKIDRKRKKRTVPPTSSEWFSNGFLGYK